MRLTHPGSMSVDPVSGAFVYQVKDVSIPCRGGMTLEISRYYDSMSEHPVNVGHGGWNFNFDERLRFEYEGDPARESEVANLSRPGVDAFLYPGSPGEPVRLRAVSVVYPDWSLDRFVVGDGAFVPTLASTATRSMAQNPDGTFTLGLPGLGTHQFREDGKLMAVVDLCGNAIRYGWTPVDQPGTNPGGLSLLQSITDPGGRVIAISYLYNETMTEGGQVFTDWSGRQWGYKFSFGTAFHLVSYIDAAGHETVYTYGDELGGEYQPVRRGAAIPVPEGEEVPTRLLALHGLYTIQFPNGEFLVNYAAGPRPLQKRVGVQIVGKRLAIHNVYDYANRRTTRLIGSRDNAVVYEYDEAGHVTRSSDAAGTYIDQYDPAGRLVANLDPRLSTRQYAYDERWNLTLASDALSNTTSYEYHPVFDVPTRIVEPGEGSPTRTMTYDEATGRLLSETDPEGNERVYTYDAHGQLTRLQHEDGSVTSFTYHPVSGDRLTMTDPMGFVTRFEHDVLGRLVRIISPEGLSIRYTYTPLDQLESITAPDGAVTRYAYDGNGNMVRATDALGNVTELVYNQLNELTEVIDALGHRGSLSYYPTGLVASVTDKLGQTTSFEYDRLGRVIRTTDPLGHVEEVSYDPYCGTATVTDALGRSSSTYRNLLCQVTKQTAPDGGFTTMTYHPDGTLASQTDANGNTTTFTYDRLQRPVEVVDALGNATRMAYDARGNLVAVTDARGNTTHYAYDGNDRLTSVTRRDGGVTSYAYDRDGRMVAVTDARGKTWQVSYDAAGRPAAHRDPLGNTSRLTRDAVGRLVEAITPLGHVTVHAYDAVGRRVRMTDPLGNEVTFSYDDRGNLRTIVDPMGRATHLGYDAAGRVVHTVDALGNVTRFTRDAVGNLVGVTDANGNTTSYSYDRLDRMSAEIYPDGLRVSYDYDRNGNLTARTDPNGFSTSYRYDAVNRPTEIRLPKVQDGPVLPYAEAPDVVFTHDANGNVLSREDATGTVRFTYDAEDRVIGFVEPNGAAYQVSYDAEGHRVLLVYPEGRREELGYDDAGRVASLRGPDGRSILYSHDADGRSTAVTYGNGTSKVAAYDAASRLLRLVHQDGSGTGVTPDLRFRYDAVGNIVSLEDDGTPLWTYGYDALDRLVSAVDEQALSTTAWTYDALGNRLTETVNGVTTRFAYNALNQVVEGGSARFFYDAAGNLRGKIDSMGVTQYLFDLRDRLVQVSLPDGRAVRYTYDEAGRMKTRSDATGTTTLEWDGWDLVRETDPAGVVTRYFLNGSSIEAFERNERHYRVHGDWLGSVRAVTDRNGTRVAAFDYDPWGNVLPGSFDNVPGGMPYRFVGSLGVRWDPDTGMHYMRQRWYDGSVGRFVGRDMVNGHNRYSYAANAPLDYVDTNGLAPRRPKFSLPTFKTAVNGSGCYAAYSYETKKCDSLTSSKCEIYTGEKNIDAKRLNQIKESCYEQASRRLATCLYNVDNPDARRGMPPPYPFPDTGFITDQQIQNAIKKNFPSPPSLPRVPSIPAWPYEYPPLPRLPVPQL